MTHSTATVPRACHILTKIVKAETITTNVTFHPLPYDLLGSSWIPRFVRHFGHLVDASLDGKDPDERRSPGSSTTPRPVEVGIGAPNSLIDWKLEIEKLKFDVPPLTAAESRIQHTQPHTASGDGRGAQQLFVERGVIFARIDSKLQATHPVCCILSSLGPDSLCMYPLVVLCGGSNSPPE